MLFSYKIVHKITTWYTSYQLVYGLHPLMPTEYIVLIVGGNKKNNNPVIVLTKRIIEPEKLQEARMQATKKYMNSILENFYGVNQRI
jgi:hypothetical protein